MQTRVKFFLVVLVAFFMAYNSSAQMQIPQPSPKAKVMQTIALTDITIDYSSPAVKGRTIWGGIVPYNELWRAGANSPTKITFSENVMIAGSTVPKGSYTLMVIPQEKTWEFILNTDSEGRGVFGYNANEDVLRFTITPEKTKDFEERLLYYISAGDNLTGTITLRWENMKASFNIQTDNMEKAKQSITTTTGRMWYDLAEAAKFQVENKLDLTQALTWAEQSVAMREHFYGYWVKAMVLEAQGNASEALVAAQKAQAIGDANPSSFYDSYKNTIADKITAWSK